MINTMLTKLSELTKDLNLNDPASEEDINKAESKIGNGGEGLIGQAYLKLWKVEEIKTMNDSYKTNEFFSGLVFIGSDGGGEAYAIDTRKEPFSFVNVPFVGSLDDLRECGKTFVEFLEYLKSIKFE